MPKITHETERCEPTCVGVADLSQCDLCLSLFYLTLAQGLNCPVPLKAQEVGEAWGVSKCLLRALSFLKGENETQPPGYSGGIPRNSSPRPSPREPCTLKCFGSKLNRVVFVSLRFGSEEVEWLS